MPEEINRIVADQFAALLFAPTAEAMRNLAKEGLAERAVQVGDVMYDAVLYHAEIANRNSHVLADLGVTAGEYAVATLHRPSSTDRTILPGLMRTLARIGEEHLPIVFPMHPRTRSAVEGAFATPGERFSIVEPQRYLDMLALIQNARMVLTDSGGVQKEAAFLGTPCVTLRDTTEWTETIEIGANLLTGFASEAILRAVREILDAGPGDWSEHLPGLYGDGRAADRITAAIIEWFQRDRRNAVKGSA
jgi:UDP-N-acetylglucosamine 2-epimerase